MGLLAWATTASVLPRPVAKAFHMRVPPNCVLEQELWGRGVTAVAGVDEVGVGALAGPLMADARCSDEMLRTGSPGIRLGPPQGLCNSEPSQCAPPVRFLAFSSPFIRTRLDSHW